jgi:hypothetical protein
MLTKTVFFSQEILTNGFELFLGFFCRVCLGKLWLFEANGLVVELPVKFGLLMQV